MPQPIPRLWPCGDDGNAFGEARARACSSLASLLGITMARATHALRQGVHQSGESAPVGGFATCPFADHPIPQSDGSDP